MELSFNILVVDGAVETRGCCEELLSASKVNSVTTCDSDGARQGLFSCPPDVVLVELAASEVLRTRFLAAIRKRYPDAKIIILSDECPPTRDALRAWAKQFEADAVLAKPFGAARLYAAIQAVRMEGPGAEPENGRPGHTPLLIFEDAPAARIATLTPRERDVLGGIVAGCTSKIIAYKLGISARTVEVHRASLMRHMGARHVAPVVRAAVEAMQRGEYSPPVAFAALLRDIYGLARDEGPYPAGETAGSPATRPTLRKMQ